MAMRKTKPIEVLVVDDSAFMRLMLKTMLERDPDITVVGTAQDGLEAVEKVADLKPDVVTLDVEMPRLDGIGALRMIMEHTPCPVVMVSSLTQQGATATMQALELGAVDFVSKASGAISLEIPRIEAEFVAKVKVAATIPPGRLVRPAGGLVPPPTPSVPAQLPPYVPGRGRLNHLTVVAASTGGPGALYQLLEALPPGMQGGLLIVQHMPAGFTAALAQHLDQRTPLSVREAAHGDRLEDGLVLVAPGGSHVQLTPMLGITLDNDTPPLHGVRPAVDVTLGSVPATWAPRCTIVILSGMGRDGARGAQRLRQQGAIVWAQDEASCVVFGMPGSAAELGIVDRMGSPEQLGRWLGELVGGGM